ncbi:sensor histidine kinase N-terminal domain-containing protein [Paracoccus pantotrophus]|uniref:histidine kinase n=1 Tax=Paracoccus pantotrophus TaxID=82367 RepID=A0A7H9BWM5_PARPN|nr:ATP-binding protein [Paracoccus pantotrophus]QLH15218.1 sensor histidine kinase N-terminal domain-containing protein [Paracoccus pantotrophus]
MTMPRSLQMRLGVSLGILLTLLWIAAAATTAVMLRHEMDRIFDSSLQEAAQRLLPLAAVEIVGREEEGVTQHLADLRDHDEFLTYIVRDDMGRILLQSHEADPSIFPEWDGPGFHTTATHRLYGEDALQGTIRLTVAEPLAHRATAARDVWAGLGLPLLVFIPAALLAIVLTVRSGLAPLRRYRDRLAERSPRDLAPVACNDLPVEVAPVGLAVNVLLAQLKSTFEAERTFAANAAHELRTPLAGAIAQAQRIQVETKDTGAGHRAAEIEASLKRLARIAERLLQLARAEGGRLRLDHLSDLRITARLVVDDIERTAPNRIALALPEHPVMSDLDPDAFGIICRNLVENALRHGASDEPIEVSLGEDGTFRVANDGLVVPTGALGRLARRFERGTAGTEGSGLGLAIVASIADRISSKLTLQSPRPGSSSGFEAAVVLPTASKQPIPPSQASAVFR